MWQLEVPATDEQVADGLLDGAAFWFDYAGCSFLYSFASKPALALFRFSQILLQGSKPVAPFSALGSSPIKRDFLIFPCLRRQGRISAIAASQQNLPSASWASSLAAGLALTLASTSLPL